MLPAVLPGIREIRGPLAAGLLWFLGAWIAFGDQLSEVPESSDPALRRLVDLYEALGPVSAGIFIGAAAYLVGAVFLRAQDFILEQLKHHYEGEKKRLAKVFAPTPSDALLRRAQEALDKASASGAVTIERAVEVFESGTGVTGSPGSFGGDVIAVEFRLQGGLIREARVPVPPTPQALLDELGAIRRRLLDRRQQLAEHLGRLEAEVELRAALVLPMLFLAVALAIEVDKWWLLLVLLPLVLILDASAASRQLERETVDSILTSAAPEDESSEIASYESAVRDFAQQLDPNQTVMAITFIR